MYMYTHKSTLVHVRDVHVHAGVHNIEHTLYTMHGILNLQSSCLESYHSSLNALVEHDNGSTLLLPYHLPKVGAGML